MKAIDKTDRVVGKMDFKAKDDISYKEALVKYGGYKTEGSSLDKLMEVLEVEYDHAGSIDGVSLYTNFVEEENEDNFGGQNLLVQEQNGYSSILSRFLEELREFKQSSEEVKEGTPTEQTKNWRLGGAKEAR